ncbi:hypothetical protein ARSEF1564_007258 [Beauveria bassiana]
MPSLQAVPNSPPLSGNNPPNYTIQKFGGTSLGKYSINIVDNIIGPYSTTSKVVAVCSARSLDTKLGGTTNRLLRASSIVNDADPLSSRALIQGIQSDHIKAIHGLIKSPLILNSLINEINAECQKAMELLTAARTLGEVTQKCLDRVISTGEKLSARVLYALLQDRAISAEYVDLSDVINFPAAVPLDHEFCNRLATRLGEVVQLSRARVTVVTGFFGRVPCGLLKGLGRGYTDLCAALLAVGIPGAQLQVWKELDGIFTADPRCVRTARLLRTISPTEASELTFYGSEVIHPLALKHAVRNEIPIQVRGVLNPQGFGCVVLPRQYSRDGSFVEDSDTDEKESGAFLEREIGPRQPAALTAKKEITMIRVQSKEFCLSHSFFTKILATLEKWRLSVDLMSTSEVQVSMALHSKTTQIVGDTGDSHEISDHDMYHAIQDLCHNGHIEVKPDMAIVSIIGSQIRQSVGLAGHIFGTLGDNGIHVEMISQGASDTSISCVIGEKDADRAICSLHERFFPNNA